ncbi:MAG: voltage-gated chloride channel protein [Verrucomicrobia bacterium]|nr:MAG: voltage-gated chloride channel protein [Verrucomicrobiota bacterium]
MKYSWHSIFFKIYTTIFWCSAIVFLAVMIGCASAFFLMALNRVTQCRLEHPWLLFFLPVAGLGIGLIYHYFWKSSEEGNNLILEQIHEPGGGVPSRMAPLVLVATLVTHLFGGSVGREGTAVQMGGSIASFLGRFLRFSPEQTKKILQCGVAAGFGAVFGTPFAGALFALEVLTSRLFFRCDGWRSLLIASFVGDFTCRAWNVHHLLYDVHTVFNDVFSPLLVMKVAIVGVAAAVVVRIFITTEHLLHRGFQKLVPLAPLRPILGGFIIIALVSLAGTRSYLGLGEWSLNPSDLTLQTFFQSGDVSYWAWAWKLLFTAVTLGSGFKGGEVTPLFFIGAALGNALSSLLGGPVDLFAALGFVAVFAGASKTPVTCTVMSIELFGPAHLVPIALVCFLSFFFSGQKGIYKSQKIA